ncbi:exocyst complex component EXO70H1-like [Phoenix dactylifera]|uniref:Exocyst subunit Exo70 family protein n=1 Tax=Phoenix dactylifera TaxID=42345 RepID=A0A8B7C076_PHODC|nr:exocyst complex component EXO70H1-like [Phoenix dactylifera]
MPRKGLRSLLPSYSFPSRHHDGRSLAPPSPHRRQQQSSAATMMEDKVTAVEAIITKWDPNASSFAKITSLFYQDRAEAHRFLLAVSDLQRAMLDFASDKGNLVSGSDALVRAQTLMQAAMRRLEKEFDQILSANRDRLDPESVSARSSRSSVSDAEDDVGGSSEDDIRAAGESIGEVERAAAIAMADLHAIAETMMSAGYGKECFRIYKILRKSIIDECLYRLGFEKLSPSQIQKMDWESLDSKIRTWLAASRVAVKTLFSGERILLDHVFAGSDSIREACFADIARDAAVQFLSFPELVAKSKRSPEKMFRILDLHDAIAELWPEIEPVFSFESTAAVPTQALNSLVKLADAARATIADFEVAMQKDTSKSPIPGGGIHPLTRYSMNFVALLADYDAALADIFADSTLHMPSSLPDFFFDTSQASAPPSPAPSSAASTSNYEENPGSPVAVRLARLILVLLCKLDDKAGLYREVSLSYLFLANNLQYIVNKIRGSRLSHLLGEEWATRHAAKARQYASNFERLGWSKVAAAIPAGEVGPAEMRERMRAFNAGLEKACRNQAEWVVADAGMREVVRAVVRGMIVPAYRGFYVKCRAELGDSAVVKFSPEDVGSRLSELFSGSDGSDSGSESYSGYRLGSGSVSGGSKWSSRSA